MKALKIVIAILVVIIAIILIPPLFMPDEIKIVKSEMMTAEPEVVFEQVNCLKNWKSWSPWEDMLTEQSFEGPECGIGAKSIWKDNQNGSGAQTIVESIENEFIKTELNFMEEETAFSTWKFSKEEDGTKVTWTMNTTVSYPVGKWIGTLFIKPEVTKSYKKGLAALNEYTKDMKPTQKWTTGEIKEITVSKSMALGIKTECAMEEMGQAMEDSYGKLMGYMQQNEVEMAGYPFTIWYEYEDPNNFIFECSMPVGGKVDGDGEIRSFESYEGKAIHVTHTGSYESTQYSWEAIMKHLEDNSLEFNGDPWEVYITDPQTEPDQSKWVTELYFPIK